MRAKAVFIPALFILFLSCENGNQEKLSNTNADSTMAAAIVSSSAAVEKNMDSIHKFIRTADLKFKVKNVVKSTADVEEITTRHGGFVTYTNLSSNIENVTTIPVSKDSSIETTSFKVVNSMILRVPNTRLDTTLKEIAKSVDFIDYRIIKADDVALQMLSNELTAKRTVENRNRLQKAIDSRSSKLTETVTAEGSVSDKQQQADNAKISNMMLADQISFSTVNLNIYQRQTVTRELMSNDRDITAYEPGFGLKILESIQEGWKILELLLVFIAKLWALFLLGLVVLLIYRSYKRVLVK